MARKIKRYRVIVLYYDLYSQETNTEIITLETSDIFHEIGLIYMSSIERIESISYYRIKKEEV